MIQISVFDKERQVGKNIKLPATKMSSPALKVESPNKEIGYGILLDKKPSYPSLQIGDKYLHSLDITLGSHSITRDWWGSGSGGHQSSWDTVQLTPGHGFINGINFDFKAIVLSGNYDGIGFHAHIKNKNDQSKVVKLSRYWGTGDNWRDNQYFNYTLTKEELDRLGGPNTEIVITTMVDNNTGSSKIFTRNIFTVTTY